MISRIARLPAKSGRFGRYRSETETAEEHPGRLGRHHEPPARGAAERLRGDERAEDEERGPGERVDERELRHDRPEPRPRAELVPAVLDLAREVALHVVRERGQAKEEEEGPAEEVRGRVDRDRPARAERSDEEAGGSRAGDAGRVPRDAEQGIRLVQVLGADRLRNDGGRRRPEERRGGALGPRPGRRGARPRTCR